MQDEAIYIRLSIQIKIHAGLFTSMKKSPKIFAIRFLLKMSAAYFLITSHLYAQPAPECLQIYFTNTRTVWQNVCEETISVAYCSLDKPIWGKLCGSGGKANVFYTHLEVLKPHEKNERNLDVLRTAPCRGRINAWDTKDNFTSEASGSYNCKDPDAKIYTSFPAVATVTDTNEDTACSNAKDMFAKSNRSPYPCKCQKLKGGKIFMCQAYGKDEKTDKSLIYQTIDSIKVKINECDPETDENKCKKTFRSPVAFGNRN